MIDTLYVVGCQVVVLKSVRGGGSRDLYPEGVVGTIVSTPSSDRATYGVRFMDGSEEAFLGSDLALLAKYRQLQGIRRIPVQETANRFAKPGPNQMEACHAPNPLTDFRDRHPEKSTSRGRCGRASR